MNRNLRCSHSSSIIHPSSFSVSFPRRNRRAGLTVLELVSALALFIIILGTLLVALNSATDTWTRSANRNRSQLKVRQALDLIATDLACAVAPQSQRSRISSGASATPGTAQEPLFIAEAKNTQIGLYFVRLLSPAELTDSKQLSLELVAYSLTTNGLSRYTQPVSEYPPELSDQLVFFKNGVTSLLTPSNVLSSATVQFEPRLYQPLRNTKVTTATQPVDPIDPVNSAINLADLPDFVDILVAYIDKEDWANSSGRTNYLTRRITLPAAQASRLP